MTDTDLSWASFDQNRGTKGRQPAQQQSTGAQAGYDGPPLNPATINAIKKFQANHGLPVTGNLDPATITKANHVANNGSSSSSGGSSSSSAASSKAAAKAKKAAAKKAAEAKARAKLQKKFSKQYHAQEKAHKREIKSLTAKHAAQLAAAKAGQQHTQAVQATAANSGVNESQGSKGVVEATSAPTLQVQAAGAPTAADKAKAIMAQEATANAAQAKVGNAAAARDNAINAHAEAIAQSASVHARVAAKHAAAIAKLRANPVREKSAKKVMARRAAAKKIVKTAPAKPRTINIKKLEGKYGREH